MSDNLDEEFKRVIHVPDLTQQQILQEQFKQERETIMTAMGSIFDALVTEPKNEVNMLPETIFVSVFLPFFAGELTPEQSKRRTAEWISIAGAPTAEVGIMDDEGELLYKVPPLFDTSSIDVTKQSGISFSEMFEQHALYRNYMPVVGTNYIMNALADKQKNYVGQSPIAEATIKAWHDIFARYDKLPKSESKTSTDSSNDGDDGLVYD